MCLAFEGRELIRQIDAVGSRSLPLLILFFPSMRAICRADHFPSLIFSITHFPSLKTSLISKHSFAFRMPVYYARRNRAKGEEILTWFSLCNSDYDGGAISHESPV
jgi:hypothetical protein